MRSRTSRLKPSTRKCPLPQQGSSTRSAAARLGQPSNVPPPRKRPLPVSIVNLADAQAVLPTSAELCDLVRAVAERQDRTAFAVLFKHFAPRVKTYLMRAGADPDAAEDLAQETMVALWRKAALFDARQAGVSTWVFTIARNLRIDRIRKESIVPLTELGDFDAPSDDIGSDEVLAQKQSAALVAIALTEIPPEQKQVLMLSFANDFSQSEIARHLNLPLGTVKSRMRLAYNRLRKTLEPIN